MRIFENNISKRIIGEKVRMGELNNGQNVEHNLMELNHVTSSALLARA